MYAVDPEPARELAQSAWGLAQLAALALLVGWLAERVLDPGVRIRGVAFMSGIVGFYTGPMLWSLTGLGSGPTLAGYALIPAFAGAMAVCAVLKLVSLGMEGSGPRW